MNDEQIQEILDREDIQLAGIDRRFVAFVIDSLIVSLVVCLLNFESLERISQSMQSNDIEQVILAMGPMLWQMIVLDVVYQWIFVAWYGASVGKILCKIEVVSIDLLDSPSVGKSFLRALLREFSQVVYYIPFVFALGDSFKRTLYDRLCQSIVIQKKR
ncbi:RDD family protein [Helicobacter sp. T3_23-1056]